jgi:hypothetical protein
MQLAGVQKAIANGRVRPPATPIPDVPVVGSDLTRGLKDLLDDNPTPEALQLLDEEARLQQHYADLEAQANAAQVQEARDAVGYDELTFEQKKAVGITADYAPGASGGLTAETAITLDERAMFARQQRLQAEALGDDDGVVAWRTEERRLERERISAAQAAQEQTQGGLFGVGEFDTSTPLLNQPPAAATPAVEIPAAASRKITAKTSEGRIQSAAESLASWTADAGGQPMSIDKALELVRAKGAILDPDQVPGLDMSAARADKTKGVANTPATDAVTAVYRQFYGLEAAASGPPSYGLLKAGTELSHGTTGKSAQAIMQTGFRPSKVETGGAILGDGVYMTDSPMYAGAYGDTALFGPLPDDARILDLVGEGKSTNEFAKEIGVGAAAEKFDGDVYFSDEQQRAIRKWATDNGYDGIRFNPVFDGSEVGAPEVVLYNLNTANRLIGSKVAVEPGSKLFPGFTPLPSPEVLPDFRMPADLQSSAPRYGMATVEFASDLDRAAYILRDPSKKSAAEDQLIRALTEQGYDIPEVRKHGQAVNDAIKAEVKAKSGSARAPQSPGAIAVTDQGFAGAQLQQRLGGVTNEVLSLDKQMNQLRNKLNQEGC